MLRRSCQLWRKGRDQTPSIFSLPRAAATRSLVFPPATRGYMKTTTPARALHLNKLRPWKEIGATICVGLCQQPYPSSINRENSTLDAFILRRSRADRRCARVPTSTLYFRVINAFQRSRGVSKRSYSPSPSSSTSNIVRNIRQVTSTSPLLRAGPITRTSSNVSELFRSRFRLIVGHHAFLYCEEALQCGRTPAGWRRWTCGEVTVPLWLIIMIMVSLTR